MMVVMHRTAYPAPGETKLPFGSSVIHEILHPDNKLQYAVYNHLLEFVLSKNVEFSYSKLLVLFRKETFPLHQENHLE